MSRPRTLADEAALRRLVDGARGDAPVAPLPGDVLDAIADGRDVLEREARSRERAMREGEGMGTERRRTEGE